jgi:hypothetical protein
MLQERGNLGVARGRGGLVAAASPLWGFLETRLDRDPKVQGTETGPEKAAGQTRQKRPVAPARRPALRAPCQVASHLGRHFRGKLSVKIFPQPVQDFRALHAFHASGRGALTVSALCA